MISTKMTKKAVVLIVDFLLLSGSLYLSLSLRSLSILSWADFLIVFKPFLIIIFINILAFYIYGLYDQMNTKIYQELNERIVSALILSSIIGAIIFYSSKIFIIAPKTILLIYIVISSLLIFVWRKNVRRFIKSKKLNRILLVAEGQELLDLEKEIKNNKVLNISQVDIINLKDFQDLSLFTKIRDRIESGKFNILAINLHHPYIKNSISLFYELLLEDVQVINFADLYEEVLGRIPLANIDAGWFFNNLYSKQDKFYERVKRGIDLLITVPLFIISLIFYPFVYLALKIQDGGDLFYISERIGKNNKVFKVYKFRSMKELKNVRTLNMFSNNESPKNKAEDDNDKNIKDIEKERITKFGKFIRKTRIDELPQLINIVNGELSLIGPRPEIPQLVKEYSNQIPFYGIRHIITPGLSGYAQIYQEQSTVPKFGISTEATSNKLSYDIYYLKHRSILLDISLALRTIKNLIGRSGV